MIFDRMLIILLIICVITDIRKRKIYNKVLFPVLIYSLIVHFANGGYKQLGLSIFGFVIGLVILIIPYFLDGIGAGDVKLLALIGFVKGPVFVMYSGLYMALIGGGIAVLKLLHEKKLIYTINMMFFKIMSRKDKDKESYNMLLSGGSFPYAIAIAGGVFINMMFESGYIIW